MVQEGRGLFGEMTVRENLLLGAYGSAIQAPRSSAASKGLQAFPGLRERSGQVAASMSGGEQQMLAVGRALMAGPKLLMLDEPSLGLAPSVAAEILNTLGELNRDGLGILLVEQKAPLALKLAQRVYILSSGSVRAELPAHEIKSHHDLAHYYFTRLRDYGYFTVGGAVFIALLFAFVFVKGGYLLTVMQLAMIYGVFCVGLNFFMGYTGQASFGQNAFAAIGGYGTAILCVEYGWEPVLALFASMGIAGIASLVVGYPTLRLRGHYLAMATFALGLITYDLSVQWTSLTQGYMGYSGIPPLGIGPFTVEDERMKLVCLMVTW